MCEDQTPTRAAILRMDPDGSNLELFAGRDLQDDALVAFHGSGIDQTGGVRGGYKMQRVHFQDGQPVWRQDLLRGFIQGSGAWGRPVGLVVAPDGSVLVSDDYGGRIFRISATRPLQAAD
jgi:glucose/arabinose dehydrogenase